MNRNNVHASFSNRGRNIEVVAPGVSFLSSVPPGQGSEAGVETTTTAHTAFGIEFARKTNGTTGTLVDCRLGQAGGCPNTVSGNIALIQRGTISFADKVTNAMNAGAIAAVIYNNAAGDFTGTLGSSREFDDQSYIIKSERTAPAKVRSSTGLEVTQLGCAPLRHFLKTQ